MKTNKVLVVMLLMMALVLGSVFANGQAEEKKSEPAKTEAAPAAVEVSEDAAGFEEFPLGDDVELAPYMNVAGVWFQPVIMEPLGKSGLTKDESNFHVEADISALDTNGMGFGKGDWIPYLTVNYEIIDQATGKVVVEGSFMPMSASDGPHYGANVALDKAGTYTVRFTIFSPETNGYLLHVDKETGVEGRGWKKPLVAEFKDWDYIPQEW